jgi:YebC/PmpR family DNA-binding regulatory protein
MFRLPALTLSELYDSRPARSSAMAGHSKWKQIKRKKAITDAKRASSWTKVIREITVAARSGGGDPGGNPRLRTAIDAAKAVNMPGENIDRAIKKGTGELEGSVYEELTYEGYGPGGAAIFIEATTDNPNRTVAEIRHAFSRNGGNLGASNSVAWMFDRKGQIFLDAARQNEDAALEAALDSGAEDFAREGDQYIITTTPAAFHSVQDALRSRGLTIDSAELAMVPRNTVRVEGADAERIVRLMDVLEELDDVSKVFSNFDIDAAQLAEAEA